MNCRNTKTNLAELLLDPAKTGTAQRKMKTHLEQCASCQLELAELRKTMALLDAWEAPEPSPFFDARMQARLRTEREARPAGMLERLRAHLLFGSNLSLRPIAAGAFALLLLIGGGTYAGLQDWQPPAPQTSAAVRDLQSLDENAQVFQQLTALDQDDPGDNGSANNL